MPITPADIQKKVFSEAKRGYNPNEVDAFLEEMGKDVEAMLRKIADLKTRLTAAESKNAELMSEVERAQAEAEKANAEAEAARASRPTVITAEPAKPTIYSATEEQLSAALIVAQQSADRIVNEAKTNAERIRQDAETQARKTIRQALDEKQSELDEIERLKKSREQFRAEYMALIQKFADAVSTNFSPMVSSSTPSGSHAAPVFAAQQQVAALNNAVNPFGAQIQATTIEDLD